jgi:hypothetical protein
VAREVWSALDQRGFQLYLLSRMSAKPLIAAALRTLGATEAESLDARGEALSLEFETPGHPAQLYRGVLGAPAAINRDLRIASTSPFAGSCALRFRLPLWPALDYVVHEHPTGYAWSPGFGRAGGFPTPALDSAADIHPFDLVIDEVTHRFGSPKTEDAWTNWELLTYRIPESPGGPLTELLLCFDFNLLQTIEKAGLPHSRPGDVTLIR